ncbi:hypothetical protein PFTANZ_03445 [Plasmodium falciparum Tanzania (2000708)]|uniref:Uncharacterized protein n=1 Tax=Plasmodium falciparum Tanzania (2000708) TaxID=1036725 RepID=A0A024W5A0_PLAFA|nr:hypothetical protein PFTANZ_03445 [Plasmodium falciparum Tanzania (2000708)]
MHKVVIYDICKDAEVWDIHLVNKCLSECFLKWSDNIYMDSYQKIILNLQHYISHDDFFFFSHASLYYL